MTPARLAAQCVAIPLVVLGSAGCARSAQHAPAGAAPAAQPLRIEASLSIGRLRSMGHGGSFLDYASAFFVDSTRGAPEAGWWRVPAGTITVTGGGRTWRLREERSAVSGVQYVEPDSFEYVPGARYVVAASGSDAVGALEAAVTAPLVPLILSPASNTTIARARDLVVTWKAGSAGDSVEVEIEPHSPSGYPDRVYRVPDTGRLVVARADLDEFPSEFVTMLTVTRRATALVAARGVSRGRFEATASDFVHVHLESRAGP